MTASLAQQLAALGLHAVAGALDDIIAKATQKRWGAVEVLSHLGELETIERARRSVESRMKSSRLGRFKPMADFEWGWPTRIDRDAVEAAVNLDFIPEKRNVVLVAAQGLGKTMVAQNIAHQAVQKGHTALFTTAAQMLLDLCSQDSARALDRRLKHYQRPTVLCIDEVGYLPCDARNADLLYQVVSRRYEEKPLVLTTNLAFGDWAQAFPNATCAIALIDRIVHHADIITIEGKSYRRRVAEEHAKKAKPKTK
jgi:DNA replication protein DnaC